MAEANTDVIEKEIVVRSPRARVWRAITDSQEFGRWFMVAMKDPFVPGARAEGQILYPGYQHLTMEVWVERMDPETLFSFRWHPYAIESEIDYSREAKTLVVFELEDVADGTRIKVTESGFDQIPLARRAKAFQMNSSGWSEQLDNIARYVGEAA
jgi:uncharacterized protein YndB with AHSA1/START domain